MNAAETSTPLDAAPVAASAMTIEGLLNRLPLIMWGTDAQLRLQWVRGGGIRMLGLDQLCSIGTNLESVFGTADHPVVERHRRALGGETQTVQIEWIDRAYDVWIEPVYEGGVVTGSIAIARDVTEAKRAERLMLVQSTFDPLTGALNRVHLCERTETLLQNARRQGAEVAAVFVDIDGFSAINDSFGAAAADQLLRTICKRIKAEVPDGTVLGRAGSDEFAVVLVANHEAVEEFCRRLQRRLGATFEVGGKSLHIGVSIGTATFPHDGMTVDRLLACAAAAAHYASDMGGRQSHDFTPSLTFDGRQRLQIESDLRDALSRNELRLVYQPQVRLSDRSISGIEVLLRWEKGGDVLPAWSFIRYAEESPVILPIGEWVIDSALAQASRWRAQGLDHGRIAINLGARQLADESIVSTIDSALEKHGIAPDSVEFEITETAAMKNAMVTARVLEDLRALGVEISIDDFGTGYSSLSYLKRFPVTALKIDKSFVADLTQSEAASGIVKAIIATAQVLGIRLVAEGVETEHQASVLQHLGCSDAQGYLFSRPLSTQAMTSFLQSTAAAKSRRRRKTA